MKIKRRIVLSLLITIAILILTNKFWLIYRPMPVSFDISGKGECSISVLLNKKDDDSFEKVRSEHVDINLADIKHVDLLVNRARKPKRVRVDITIHEILGDISISNIKLRKFSIENLDKFDVKGAIAVIKNDKLILEPNEKIIILTYQETLNVRSAIKFDFKVFVIILVLIYLFAYKLTNYVADFKTIENKSRIEIIFLTIFFLFLFLPMSHINQNEISKQENRYLAKWKPLITEHNEINFNFGKDFNAWFNDRFLPRQMFVNFYNGLHYFLESECEKAYFDKKNLITYPKGAFYHIPIAVIKENFRSLYLLNTFCEKNNIKLYILIVPKKSDVHLIKNPFIKEKYMHDDFLEFLESLKKDGILRIVYPYYEMKKALEQGNLMYFKTEHHWTDDGAYVAYKALMNLIEKDFLHVKQLEEKDFSFFYDKKVRGEFWRDFGFGQDCWRIGISDALCREYHQYDYRYYRHREFDKLETSIINEKYMYGKEYYYGEGANYRVVQLGTSQNENLTEFLPFTFKNVKRIRNNCVKGINSQNEFKIMKYWEQDILDYKPDILVFCITYDNIASLKDLFNRE